MNQDSANSDLPIRHIAFGVYFSTLATLLLELTLTRIFSVILYYHFAFLAISVALFGLGLGGLFSYAHKPALGTPGTWKRLGVLAILTTLSVFWMLWFVISFPLPPLVSMQVFTPSVMLLLVAAYFICSTPFVLAGICISSAISLGANQVSRIYSWDLLGAATGCVLLVPLLNLLGGPGTLLAVGAMYAASAGLWFHVSGQRIERLLSFAFVLVIGIAAFFTVRNQLFDLRYAKGMPIENELFSRWNSFSRISVEPYNRTTGLNIKIDGDASTLISDCAPEQLSADQIASRLLTGPGLVHQLRPAAKTLVIGAGGGDDVCLALLSGSSDVTAVEINPLIANEVMRDKFVTESRGLYLRPEVDVVVEDGRSFAASSSEVFQVIQMTLVDSWASTSAGAFALTENQLYTVEALRDFLGRLSNDGILSITRWEFPVPRESLRLTSVGIEALRQEGAAEPKRHIVIARLNADTSESFGSKDTILIKKTPFTPDELYQMRRAIEESGMDVVFISSERTENPFSRLLSSATPSEYISEYPFDISPVTDNRPFFFYSVRFFDSLKLLAQDPAQATKINLGITMLFLAVLISVVAVSVIMSVPMFLGRRENGNVQSIYDHLLYFFSIGFGFIVVEVALVQRTVLYLGQPTYALTVVIFALLIATSFGSRFSNHVVRDSSRRLAVGLVSVFCTVALLAVILPPVLDRVMHLPVLARSFILVLLIAPSGFLMGIAFPAGVRRLEYAGTRAVCWAWATNASASVFGSVAAVLMATQFGLRETMWVGATAYLVAAFALYAGRSTVRFR